MDPSSHHQSTVGKGSGDATREDQEPGTDHPPFLEFARLISWGWRQKEVQLSKEVNPSNAESYCKIPLVKLSSPLRPYEGLQRPAAGPFIWSEYACELVKAAEEEWGTQRSYDKLKSDARTEPFFKHRLQSWTNKAGKHADGLGALSLIEALEKVSTRDDPYSFVVRVGSQAILPP